jgi:multiple sugar transport system ATP-binding protein
MAPILEIRDMCKSFGPVDVLKDINVSIEPGEFLVLVGPSGCGKSTLLNCIAGLESITSGTIEIGGEDMTDVPPKDRDIAMVFQSYALYPTMSVAKNITFGMRVRGVDKSTQERKLAEVARLLQIEPLLDRRPRQLSGGQRQRVAMGRALVRDPKLFLFDEPLSNLDAKLRVEMRAEIRKLHQTLSATMVYVTHDQIEAMTLATKIAVLKAGVVHQIGSPTEIYNRPVNMFVADFMGSPSMNLIPARTRRDGAETRIEIERPDAPPLVLTETREIDLPERVVVGLRPEDIAEAGLRSGPHVQTGTCRIDFVEPSGADTYVLTKLGGIDVIGRFHAETASEEGKEMDFAFDLAKVSYFDPETEKRLN